MSYYQSDIRELYVFDKKLKQEGKLKLYTEIIIRGKPNREPVPVTVNFVARFTADEKYQEVDLEDGDVDWVTYEKKFEKKDDHDFYTKSFFEEI